MELIYLNMCFDGTTFIQFVAFFSRNQAQIAYILCKDTKQDDGLNSQKMKCVDTLKIYSKQTS